MVSFGGIAPKQQQGRIVLRNGFGGGGAGGIGGSPKKKRVSPALVFAAFFLVIVGIYVSVVAWFSVSSSSPLHRQSESSNNAGIAAAGGNSNNNNQGKGNARIGNTKNNVRSASSSTAADNNKNNNAKTAEQQGLEELKRRVKEQERQPIVKHFKPKPKGEGIKPQVLLGGDTTKSDSNNNKENADTEHEVHPDPSHIMKAFVEPIKFEDWDVKPLPVRSTATKDQLQEISFPRVNSCKRLPERWPADEYPDQDTFLPWIHDVFPTDNGEFIQFVAENRRRCHTGTTESELQLLFKTQPSVALFQHVPVKRLDVNKGEEPRYRLSSHEEADEDGMATRFICRFKPTMEETLSVFNFDYDWASIRKKNKVTFKFDDGGIKSVHTAQLLFKCPVPEGLQKKIQSGETVINDFATLFVDLIPIRTPPRYGAPNQFLQPRYNSSQTTNETIRFDANKEWGSDHILPKVEDSGRWENIPICRPSFLEYYGETSSEDGKGVAITGKDSLVTKANRPPKKHRLVSCIWASAGYTTRGERFAINDGQRRLLEWIHFNKLLGFEHFYLYDNSYAFSNETTLKPIADLFPDVVTHIKWPFQICNNNPNNVDSPGDRSSQYAAEASCRLRFGPHVEWIGQFDIDEYLVPMGSYTSILPLLDKLDEEGKKIVSFGSWRAWPRRDFIA